MIWFLDLTVAKALLSRNSFCILSCIPAGDQTCPQLLDQQARSTNFQPALSYVATPFQIRRKWFLWPKNHGIPAVILVVSLGKNE